MKKPIKISDELLFDYIDGSLNHADRLMVEEACKKSPWKERLQELTALDTSLLSIHDNWAEPAEGFNTSIMKNISAYEATPKTSRRNIILLSALILTCIIGCISLSSLPASYYMNQLLIPQEALNNLNINELPKSIAINLQLVIEGSLFVCALLALILFDRIILKPFFSKRKVSSSH
ncbi:hypothetical protein LVD15_03240 [Fulvivirga maritima]|uniref:hypothetical protein n=1 Tax=Fulvivirga maritima TaxID=2904247 RepID=UPI001F1B2563|nr:hypothetical protein [Fulvivirga maritima]UII27460.1 hypothetical protein LVD15_03240 [Fulvivirga maritima]